MRLLLAVGALLGISAASQAIAGIPPWLYFIGGLVGSGVLIRYYTAKTEKNLQEATAERTHAEAEGMADALQEKVIRRASEQYNEMALELKDTKMDLSEHRRRAAEAETHYQARISELEAESTRRQSKYEALARRHEQLHDELLNTRAEAGLLERRDPPEHQPEP